MLSPRALVLPALAMLALAAVPTVTAAPAGTGTSSAEHCTVYNLSAIAGVLKAGTEEICIVFDGDTPSGTSPYVRLRASGPDNALGAAFTQTWSIVAGTVTGCTAGTLTQNNGASAATSWGNAYFTVSFSSSSRQCAGVAQYTLVVAAIPILTWQGGWDTDTSSDASYVFACDYTGTTAYAQDPNAATCNLPATAGYDFQCANTATTARTADPGTSSCAPPAVANLNFLCNASDTSIAALDGTTCATPNINADVLARLCGAAPQGTTCNPAYIHDFVCGDTGLTVNALAPSTQQCLPWAGAVNSFQCEAGTETALTHSPTAQFCTPHSEQPTCFEQPVVGTDGGFMRTDGTARACLMAPDAAAPSSVITLVATINAPPMASGYTTTIGAQSITGCTSLGSPTITGVGATGGSGVDVALVDVMRFTMPASGECSGYVQFPVLNGGTTATTFAIPFNVHTNDVVAGSSSQHLTIDAWPSLSVAVTSWPTLNLGGGITTATTLSGTVNVGSWPTLTLAGTVNNVNSGSVAVHQDPLSGTVTLSPLSGTLAVHQDPVSGTLAVTNSGTVNHVNSGSIALTGALDVHQDPLTGVVTVNPLNGTLTVHQDPVSGSLGITTFPAVVPTGTEAGKLTPQAWWALWGAIALFAISLLGDKKNWGLVGFAGLWFLAAAVITPFSSVMNHSQALACSGFVALFGLTVVSYSAFEIWDAKTGGAEARRAKREAEE